VLNLAGSAPDPVGVSDRATGAIALVATATDTVGVTDLGVGFANLIGSAPEPVAVTDTPLPALLSTAAPPATTQWRIGAENRVWVILEERTWRIPNDSVPAEEV
jgi:hypothetical protein